eukprot:6021797-Pyramimonas_sp.AAC.1
MGSASPYVVLPVKKSTTAEGIPCLAFPYRGPVYRSQPTARTLPAKRVLAIQPRSKESTFPPAGCSGCAAFVRFLVHMTPNELLEILCCSRGRTVAQRRSGDSGTAATVAQRRQGRTCSTTRPSMAEVRWRKSTA